MPLPTVKKDETESEFVDRCMGTEVMQKDYTDEKQRLAVCYSIFKKKDEKKGSENVIERRIMANSEVRVDGKKEERIVGYSAVFDVLSEEMGFRGVSFREKIAKGAFANTILQDDIRALRDHIPEKILGRNKAGTLILSEDEHGLYFEIIPPDTSYARDLKISIKRGDVTQNSFGFSIKENGESWDSKEKTRTLTNVTLFDVSPVTYPAYPQTEVYVRSKGNIYILPEDKLFFSEPNPTVTILPRGKENDEAKPTEIIPQPQFMSPDFWAKFENIVNRRK